MRRFVPLLVLLAAASVGRADDLVGRFRVDAADDQARWHTGTHEVAPDGRATRVVDGSSGSGRARRAGDVVTVEGRPARGLVHHVGPSQDARAAVWRAEYRDDGRGGFVGTFDGPDGRLTETLTPLLDDPASIEPVLAGLRRKRPGPADARRLLDLARAARAQGLRPARALVEAVRGERLLERALAAAGDEDRRALAAIVREVAPPLPGVGDDFERAFAAMDRAALAAYEYPLIVVPGYTPKDAPRLHDLHPIARKRCERAAADFHAGRAPFVLVTGGAVHPEDTPVIEALQLRAELVRLGVPAERIAVDAAARHSTTNLRNAARFMLARGLDRALVVTSFGQSFYFSSPGLSTFHRRSRRELGYEVGRMRRVDPYRTAFFPDPRALTPGDDPLDP